MQFTWTAIKKSIWLSKNKLVMALYKQYSSETCLKNFSLYLFYSHSKLKTIVQLSHSLHQLRPISTFFCFMFLQHLELAQTPRTVWIQTTFKFRIGTSGAAFSFCYLENPVSQSSIFNMTMWLHTAGQ